MSIKTCNHVNIQIEIESKMWIYAVMPLLLIYMHISNDKMNAN